MASIWNRTLLPILLAVCLPALAKGSASISERDVDFGPFWTRDITLDGSSRNRILGPFWESQTSKDGHRLRSFRPLYTRMSETNTPKVLNECLWPVATIKTFRNESYWRVVTWFGHDFDNTQPSRYKNHFYPLMFQGRAADGSGYFSLFPVGGTIKEFVGRDKVSFALFPLYAKSQVNEAVSYDVLWPFISWGSREGASRWRVFPFYGEAESYGNWKRRFVMWPVWSSVSFQKEPGGGFILFPVTGYSRVADERTYWMIPPFFKWQESPERRVVNCPWPFFQYRTGTEDRLYFWPVWGKRQHGESSRSFFLWPVFHAGKTVSELDESSSFYALPFVYSDKTVRKGKEGVEAVDQAASRYFKLWPLFSYRREGDVSRFRSLELWPLKYTAPVERNFAPLWTLYTRERQGQAFDTEILWGMYRNRKGQDGERVFSLFPLISRRSLSDPQAYSSWKILAGFLGHEVDDGVGKWKVLYFFNFGGKKELEQ